MEAAVEAFSHHEGNVDDNHHTLKLQTKNISFLNDYENGSGSTTLL